MAGYFKVYREQLEYGLIRKPYMLQVWIFLCKQAQYQKTVKDGIELLPGQLLISAEEIAQECCQTKDKVKYNLSCLAEQGLIRRENIRNRYSLITILEPDWLRTPQPALPSAPAQKPAVPAPSAVPAQATNKQYTSPPSVQKQYTSPPSVQKQYTSPPSVQKQYTSPPSVQKQYLSDTVSYDLERAERQARENVPVLRKRKRGGQ